MLDTTETAAGRESGISSEALASLKAEIAGLAEWLGRIEDRVRATRLALADVAKPPRAEVIMAECAREWRIDEAALSGQLRTDEVVQARHACMLLLRLTQLSTLKIGALLRRDHASVIYAERRFRDRVALDPKLQSRVAGLAARLNLTLPL